MSKLDQLLDKQLRKMAKFNINSSDPGERKACGESKKKWFFSPVLILMFSDFTWRRIGREKFPLSFNIIAQTLELELNLWILNSHVTKRSHPPRQNLLYHILCISLIVSYNPRVFLYIWSHQICSQYPGFVIQYRFTADKKFYPRFFLYQHKMRLSISIGVPWNIFGIQGWLVKMHFRGFWHWGAKRSRHC